MNTIINKLCETLACADLEVESDNFVLCRRDERQLVHDLDVDGRLLPGQQSEHRCRHCFHEYLKKNLSHLNLILEAVNLLKSLKKINSS